MSNKNNLKWVLPVLFSFFVMSFVDLVGIGVDRVTYDFKLSSTMAQLIPMVAFLWFFVLSVPVSVLQARIGKRKMLNIGMLITALGLLFPFFVYSFATILVGFALLGIGNTIVQVSANPLLVMVVPENRSSSYLSFSQFIKAVGSMIGAPLAAVFALKLGDWKLMFLVFGIVSLLAVLWLGLTPITEHKKSTDTVTLKSAFSLLSNNYILLMVLSIFLVVGVDVGFNSFSGQFFIKKLGLEQAVAESGRSVYFFGRMIGTFAGALLLTKINSRSFLIWTSLLSILSVIVFVLLNSEITVLVFTFIIGLTVANVFPLVFSITVQQYPENSNEISGLMMMAVSGGAVIPFIMGMVNDQVNAVAAILVLAICMFVVLMSALKKPKTKTA